MNPMHLASQQTNTALNTVDDLEKLDNNSKTKLPPSTYLKLPSKKSKGDRPSSAKINSKTQEITVESLRPKDYSKYTYLRQEKQSNSKSKIDSHYISPQASGLSTTLKKGGPDLNLKSIE